MKTYDDYFSADAIITALCRIRLSRASSIHRRRFHRKIFKFKPESDYSELNRLFPPRKLWHKCRPRKRERQGHTQPGFDALLKCINKHKGVQPEPVWMGEINRLIENVQRRVLRENSFEFRAPEIVPQQKANPDEFRAIASFPNIEDKIVDIINAKYLRESLEVCLEDAARAFRSGRKRHLDRNSAINAIYQIRQRHPDKALFVTECDIRGFFDCVHHPIAKVSLCRAVELLKVRQPEVRIDPRAITIFNRYLDCYTFSKTTLGLEGALKSRTENPRAIYKWPTGGDANLPNTLNHYHRNPKRSRIGVPQGGAHSCLIANLILDLADKEVSLTLHSKGGDSIYLRYCDDIIIIAEEKSTCVEATESYYRALRAVKLPYHLATSLNGSLKQFFEDSKTKECFRWGAKQTDQLAFPWIQFLGYQIRYDGRIRIRPSSIRKQMEKIEDLSESLRKHVTKAKAKVSRRQILYRFNSKLWAFSSGRVKIHAEHLEPLPMCWASGFRQLAKRPFHPAHIRRLDQLAGKERRRLKRHLHKFQLDAKSKQETRKSNKLRYFGRPFSHRRQFDGAKSQSSDIANQ
jgi:hypothetical protein